jgi:uncharacterized protein YutE (UPF0331/DUF86 family)
MTDAARIAKRLARIETCLADLRRHARIDAIPSDVREQRFVEHTLQVAIRAALDTASHVVSDRRLGEPRTNGQRDGWISEALAVTLRRMAGFRNVLVHGYDDVDLRVVEDVVRNHLGDLEAFVAAIRSRTA